MKAADVDYVRPGSLTEATELLAKGHGEARVIAGGQSLVAMMNLRLASPGLLIDISRLPELTVAAEDAETVTLGACITHAAIEDGRLVDPSRGLMPRVAVTLGYRAIRTRGTIGGSLALSDPAAEWPAVLMALDAEAILCGPGGRRSLKCTDLATGIFETQLAADEIIESVRPVNDAFFGTLRKSEFEALAAIMEKLVDSSRDAIVQLESRHQRTALSNRDKILNS